MSAVRSARRAVAGAFVAPTEEKLRRLLGVPRQKWPPDASNTKKVELLASAAADSTGSQWAIAVGQAHQGKNTGRYVVVVFRLPDGRLEGRQVSLRGTGQSARSRLTTQLLDQLRRRLR